MSNDNFKGAWVFLSHSNKDFKKVRRVRNEFEEIGHRPILFFLKCMDNDPEQAMPLIFAEIEAREWFMLCKSKNTTDSPYVRREVKFIKRLKGKVYEELDLNDKWEKQREKIHALAKRATVFISYSARDRKIAKAIADTLLEHDFGVWFDAYSIKAGDDWQSSITVGIKEAVKRGFFLVLLSPEAIRSEFVRDEVDFALKMQQDRKASNILPIIVRNRLEVFDGLASVNLRLTEIQSLDLTKGTFDENMTKLIEYLKTVKMK